MLSGLVHYTLVVLILHL